MQNHFNEDDKEKFIKFLNSVAIHAKFELNTQELCEYFKLLVHMQQVMLPKLDANILEVKRVVQAKAEEAKPEPEPKKSARKK